MLLKTINCFIFAPAIWVISSLATAFAIFFTLTLLWRAYKTVLVRQSDWLSRRELKNADARQLVIVTGASSGIGLAVAKHLFRCGYSVLATFYDSNDVGVPELKQLAKTSGRAGARLILRQLDVTNGQQVAELYAEVDKLTANTRELYLYALINNAGLGSLQQFAWLQRKTLRNLVETNIMGSLMLTRELLPLLVRSKSLGGSRILWVSSGLGFVPGATYATYGLTKTGLLYFSQCMNLELRDRYGVQSVAMIPHNFIKNTQICAQNVKTNELAWDELKPLERELYAQEHKKQVSRAKSLEAATLELTKVSERQTSTGTKRDRPRADSRPTSAPIQFARHVLQFLIELAACLRGENLAPTIEESGTPECFENALRLRNPPEFVFAGDSKFQLVIGTLLLCLPYSCLRLLGKSVAPSLYR